MMYFLQFSLSPSLPLSLVCVCRHLKDVILLTAIVQVLSTLSSYFWYIWLLVRWPSAPPYTPPLLGDSGPAPPIQNSKP